MRAANHHCSVIELDDRGILIEGAPGAGKTSLALGAIGAAKAAGLTGFLIADDQASLHRHGDTIRARPIASIAGKAELFGFGIVAIEHKHETALSLAVRLVADESVERMPAPRRTALHGIELPLLELPQRHEAQAIRILMAWLTGSGPLG